MILAVQLNKRSKSVTIKLAVFGSGVFSHKPACAVSWGGP